MVNPHRMTTAPTINAGIPVSLTGQFATQGRQALAGLQAWVGRVNAAGGLSVGERQHPVSLTHLDDGSMADGARRATEQLINVDGVDLLFGPYSAGLTTAAAEVAESQGRLLWNHGGAGDAVYARGYRNVIAVLTPADRYLSDAPALVRQADPNGSTMVIVRIDTGAFARMVARGVETAGRDLGFTMALELRYRPTQFQFAEIARAIAEKEPDLVVGVGRIRHDIALARALANLPSGSRVGLAAVVATPIAQFADALGPDADRFIGPSQWEPQSSIAAPDFGPGAMEALAILQGAAAGAGLPVDYPMAQAFAAGLVAERCVIEAGTLDDNAVRDSADLLDFTTFYGRFRLDETGRQVGRSVALVQRQHGEKVVVWPPESADGKLQYPYSPV